VAPASAASATAATTGAGRGDGAGGAAGVGAGAVAAVDLTFLEVGFSEWDFLDFFAGFFVAIGSFLRVGRRSGRQTTFIFKPLSVITARALRAYLTPARAGHASPETRFFRGRGATARG
jgi:hypothetical protein